MERSAIEVKNLSLSKTLDNVSIVFEALNITAICGTNMDICNSLLKTFCGLNKINKGSIVIFNHKILQERNYILNFLGYMPKESNSLKNLTVINYFKYSNKFYKGNYLSNAISLLNKFNINYEEKIKNLNPSDRRIISFIDSIYFNPEVVILEEPFFNIDYNQVFIMKEVLLKLRDNGTSIIFSTPSLENTEIADKTVIMQNDKIIDIDIKSIQKCNYKKVTILTNSDTDISILTHLNITNVIKFNNHISFIFKGNILELLKITQKLNIIDITINYPSIKEILEIYD